jgi:hypothetical protein
VKAKHRDSLALVVIMPPLAQAATGWTPLAALLSPTLACLGSWMLSASYSPVPDLFDLLYARFMPRMFCWLGLLSLIMPCPLAVFFLLSCCGSNCDLNSVIDPEDRQQWRQQYCLGGS